MICLNSHDWRTARKHLVRQNLGKNPITKNALIGVGGPLQNQTKIYLKLPHELNQLINYIFLGETYDESEALGEPLADESQIDEVVLPSYGAPASTNYGPPQPQYQK